MPNIHFRRQDRKRETMFLSNLIMFLVFSTAVLADATVTGNKTVDWSAVSVFIVIVGALVGWISTRREKGKVANLMTKIDMEYSSYKLKPNQCENELYRLRQAISDEFKKGKIDSTSYSILDKRIDDYLIELRQRIVSDGFEGMPGKLKGKLSKALEDGTINEADLKMLTEFLKTSGMSEKKKTQFEQMIKEWKKEDSGEVKHEKKSFIGEWMSKVPWTANRIAIFAMILAAILFLGAIAVLSKGNGGGIVLLVFGILTITGGIYLKRKKAIGIKLLKIAFWILCVFLTLLFLGEKNPVALILLPIIITALYHLYYISVGV